MDEGADTDTWWKAGVGVGFGGGAAAALITV